MDKKKNIYIILVLLGIAVIIGIAWMTSIMVPLNPNSAEKKVKVGKLTRMTLDSSTGDVNLYLDGGSEFYYIDRGLQQKMPIEEWQKITANRQVRITYHPSGRNLFGTQSHHVYQLSYDDSIFYNELK